VAGVERRLAEAEAAVATLDEAVGKTPRSLAEILSSGIKKRGWPEQVRPLRNGGKRDHAHPHW
jgi:hypothetical protein